MTYLRHFAPCDLDENVWGAFGAVVGTWYSVSSLVLFGLHVRILPGHLYKNPGARLHGQKKRDKAKGPTGE